MAKKLGDVFVRVGEEHVEDEGDGTRRPLDIRDDGVDVAALNLLRKFRRHRGSTLLR